jgi:predicted short-subunit dehydrogenase-like oxidoreductase (DUF2520 family)
VVGDGPVGKAFMSALGAAGHEMIQRKSIPDLLEFADLVVFAIPDDQLELTITGITEGRLWKPGQMVAHTSGKFGYGIFAPAIQAGSIPLAIHPAMKFTGNSSDLVTIRESYFAVAAPAVALPIAQALVIEMGAEPITIDEEDREKYYEAIQVASNFSSLIVNQSIGLLEEIGIEPATQMLAPLIRSSVEVALAQGHKPIDPTELLDQ